MDKITLSMFRQTVEDAQKVRDAMNDSLPKENAVTTEHVLSQAAGMGIGELMRQFNIDQQQHT